MSKEDTNLLLSEMDKEFKKVYGELMEEVKLFKEIYGHFRGIAEVTPKSRELIAKKDPEGLKYINFIEKETTKIKALIKKQVKYASNELKQYKCFLYYFDLLNKDTKRK